MMLHHRSSTQLLVTQHNATATLNHGCSLAAMKLKAAQELNAKQDNSTQITQLQNSIVTRQLISSVSYTRLSFPTFLAVLVWLI